MLDARILTCHRGFLGGALALAALLTGCGGGGGSGPLDVAGLNYPRPRDYPIHGIDVSKFQGDIDWSQVAGSGVQFAWIKASEGGDRADERFEANWQGAKAAGVPHGAYHFVYWCRPPMEEMANFEQSAPVEPDALPPVLDVEATPTSRTCHRHLDPGRRHPRHAGHAGRDGAPLRQAAGHLHDRRLLPGDPRPTAPSPTIRSGCARPNTTPPSDTPGATGGSGSTSPTRTSPGSGQGRPRRVLRHAASNGRRSLQRPDSARPAPARPSEPAPPPVEVAATSPGARAGRDGAGRGACGDAGPRVGRRDRAAAAGRPAGVRSGRRSPRARRRAAPARRPARRTTTNSRAIPSPLTRAGRAGGAGGPAAPGADSTFSRLCARFSGRSSPAETG